MDLAPQALHHYLPGLAAALYAVMLLWALRGVDYLALRAAVGRQHAIYGFSVLLMLLWSVRATPQTGLSLHLLGITALTLLAGWRLALLGGLFAVVGSMVLLRESGQSALLATFLLLALPVGVTHLVWCLSRRYLPRQPFVYILVCAFFGSMLASASAHLAVAAVTFVAAGGAGGNGVWSSYAASLPLLLFPEALLNGGVITFLVAYRPEWLATFEVKSYFGGYAG